jgi:hypothetical protein
VKYLFNSIEECAGWLSEYSRKEADAFAQMRSRK